MAAQDIGVAYVHVEPSGKGFGKSIEGDIGDAVNKASKKSSSTLISKIGGAFGKIGKVGTGAIAIRKRCRTTRSSCKSSPQV